MTMGAGLRGMSKDVVIILQFPYRARAVFLPDDTSRRLTERNEVPRRPRDAISTVLTESW